MTINELKSLACKGSVLDILETFFGIRDYAKLMGTICNEAAILKLWADDNYVDNADIIDAIELSLGCRNRLVIDDRCESDWIGSRLNLANGVSLFLVWDV